MGLNLLTWPMPLNLSYLIGFWPINSIIITSQNYVTRSVRIRDIEIHRLRKFGLSDTWTGMKIFLDIRTGTRRSQNIPIGHGPGTGRVRWLDEGNKRWPDEGNKRFYSSKAVGIFYLNFNLWPSKIQYFTEHFILLLKLWFLRISIPKLDLVTLTLSPLKLNI